MKQESKLMKQKEGDISADIDCSPIEKTRSPLSGSFTDDFTNILAVQTLQTLFFTGGIAQERDKQLLAMGAAMAATKPQDEIEGAISSQMISSHNAALQCFSLAMNHPLTHEQKNMYLSTASKLTKSYASLVEALCKYRNKGISEQRVTVQHIHVNNGSQAIVGNVVR
jgi:hypothetical protein